MILVIAKLLNSWFKIDLQKAQRWVIIGLMVLIGVFVLVFALTMRSCFKKTPKLDEAEIQKAQQAIAVEDRKVMVEILANSDAKEAVADNVSANADVVKINTLKESRDKWSEATVDEMTAELERRAKQ